MTRLARYIPLAAAFAAVPAFAEDCPAPAQYAVAIALATPAGLAHGSGFVWDRSGRIVTNHHVVTAGQAPRLTYADGRTVPARLVAESPAADLAVLEPVAATPFPLAAPHAAASRGQTVVAIGNPGGRGLARSEGVVTALGRLVDSAGRRLPDMIETTVPLVPGDSGGPLFDCTGRFVGLDAAAVLTPGDHRAGYAIPASTVDRIVAGLLALPSAPALREPPRLGLLVRPAIGGLAVVAVGPDSPAERAGVRTGDILRRIGPLETLEPRAVPAALDALSASGSVPLAIDRAGLSLALMLDLSNR